MSKSLSLSNCAQNLCRLYIRVRRCVFRENIERKPDEFVDSKCSDGYSFRHRRIHHSLRQGWPSCPDSRVSWRILEHRMVGHYCTGCRWIDCCDGGEVCRQCSQGLCNLFQYCGLLHRVSISIRFSSHTFLFARSKSCGYFYCHVLCSRKESEEKTGFTAMTVQIEAACHTVTRERCCVQ